MLARLARLLGRTQKKAPKPVPQLPKCDPHMDARAAWTRVVEQQAPRLAALFASNETSPQFTLVRAKSTLGPHAGWGVFVNGIVHQNDLVCCFPGTIYDRNSFGEAAAWHLGADPLHALVASPDSAWTAQRVEDGVFIDGRDRGLAAVIFQNAAFRDGRNGESVCSTSWLFSSGPKEGSDAWRHLPLWWAVGQYVNHPPSGVLPNVAFHGADLNVNDLPAGVRHCLPVVDFQPVQGQDNAPLRAIFLMATRDIEDGEELWVDYAYNPNHCPDWFCPVDYGSSVD